MLRTDSASATAQHDCRHSLRPATTTTTAATPRGASGRRSVDAESSRTYNVDAGSTPTSSAASSPRTYVVDAQAAAATDDESSRSTSPGRPRRRCRHRRRPRSPPLRDKRPAIDGAPEVGDCSSRRSTDATLYSKSASQSLRQRGRASTAGGGFAGDAAASSVPELRRPPARRHHQQRSGAPPGVDAAAAAEPAWISAPPPPPPRGEAAAGGGGGRASRLPRLVARGPEAVPSSSSLSSTAVRAPRPRSFRYSRLHRRAVDALVPPPVRDIPWRWAWKASSRTN